MNNTCPIRVTAAAGTNLAGTFPISTFIIFEIEQEFTRLYPFFSSTESCWIAHFMHVQDSLLLPKSSDN